MVKFQQETTNQTHQATSRFPLNPRLRIIVCPCRSGSMALLNCLAQHPEVEAHSQAVKKQLRQSGSEDYTLFYQEPGASLVVDKETLGPHTPTEATLQVFPDDNAIANARPLFVFRDPVYTWNGWVGQGWLRRDLFELAYISAFQKFLHCLALAPSAVLCLTYEAMTRRPHQALTTLCAHWGVPYHPDMLHWRTNLEPTGRIHGGEDYRNALAQGRFSTVQKTKTLQVIHRPLTLSTDEIQQIEESPLRAIYTQVTQHCPLG